VIAYHEAGELRNMLKDLKVEISESALIWRVLESLPPRFDVMRTSYNTERA